MKKHILQESKRRLEAGENDFICTALGDQLDDDPVKRQAILELKAVIEAGLQGEISLNSFLQGCGLCLSGHQFRLARLAWLDKLISLEPPMNKQQAAIFHAKTLIKSGADDYICHALEHVGHKHQNLADAAKQVQQQVAAGLGGHATLGNWAAHHGLDERLAGVNLWARLARLAWLDKLSQDFA